MGYHYTTRSRSFALHVQHKKTAPCTYSVAVGVVNTEQPVSKQGLNGYNVTITVLCTMSSENGSTK